jgi:hypothetical protein
MYENERLESVALRACSQCADERRGPGQRRPAGGYVCSPDGVRIVTDCDEHAAACIAEYSHKLGQRWSYETPSGRRIWSPAERALVGCVADNASCAGELYAAADGRVRCDAHASPRSFGGALAAAVTIFTLDSSGRVERLTPEPDDDGRAE